ncbi:MAG: hypothetical protein GQ569_00795 [Methylococcaceae bacterium]|nr:hypothetical protein [Methylococcaceae bacterium]
MRKNNDKKPLLYIDEMILQQHHVALGEKKVCDLLQKFYESSTKTIHEIDTAYQLKHFQIISEQAHKLAGTSLMLGFSMLGSYANEVEIMATNVSMVALGNKLVSLKQCHLDTMKELKGKTLFFLR